MTQTFDDSDKTIVIPRPGGIQRAVTKPTAEDETIVPELNKTSLGATFSVSGIGTNAILDAATTLIALAVELRNTPVVNNVDLLHKQCLNHMRDFENQLRKADVDMDDIADARYCLCTVIDETVLNTPWGTNSMWSTKSLLSIFYKQTWGGEQFFAILESRLANPAKHKNLLEFMYVCLQLGFEGKFRVDPNGYKQLDEYKDRLYRELARLKGELNREMSPRWRSNVPEIINSSKNIPVWMVGLVLSAVLLGLYMTLSYQLSEQADPVYKRFATLIPETQIESENSQMYVDYAKQLRQLLSTEIELNKLIVVEKVDRVSIVILNGQMFDSASASLNESYMPLLEKVGQVLTTVPGSIEVIGHSDDQKIFTARYHSNWELSLARANSVVRYLSGNDRLATRITAEGRGDAEPMFPNDSESNRAKNRRVEIMVSMEQRNHYQQIEANTAQTVGE
ncbi:type IVB secretion system protein IcmH/DotU [Kangiella marina]|uniref:DotU family type VI secretion system protein n=1 Tax=Kangiella marina TaxID=1079178 RepID=A0ABP8IIY9_9GAMM